MTKLRLKVWTISSNSGAITLVPAEIHEVQYLDKKGKAVTEAQAKKAKPGEIESKSVQIHPQARLILVPMKDDKTKYAVDQVYEFELKKA